MASVHKKPSRTQNSEKAKRYKIICDGFRSFVVLHEKVLETTFCFKTSNKKNFFMYEQVRSLGEKRLCVPNIFPFSQFFWHTIKKYGDENI